MSDCTKCFRYRSKEREIDALRHELALLEGYNKALRAMAADLLKDDCVMTARADPYPNAFLGGGGAGAGSWQQALGQANQAAQQNAVAMQAQMQKTALQQALAQQQAQQQAMPAHQHLGANGGLMSYTMGCGGAGGAGGNGGNGNSVSARAWCETHKRWADECNAWRRAHPMSVGDASKSVIAAIKKAMGMDVTA